MSEYSELKPRPEPEMAQELRQLFLKDQVDQARHKMRLLASLDLTNTAGYREAAAHCEEALGELGRLQSTKTEIGLS